MNDVHEIYSGSTDWLWFSCILICLLLRCSACYKTMCLEVIAVLHYNKHEHIIHAYVSKTCVSSK